jgi:hypothetical protein
LNEELGEPLADGQPLAARHLRLARRDAERLRERLGPEHGSAQLSPGRARALAHEGEIPVARAEALEQRGDREQRPWKTWPTRSWRWFRRCV